MLKKENNIMKLSPQTSSNSRVLESETITKGEIENNEPNVRSFVAKKIKMELIPKDYSTYIHLKRLVIQSWSCIESSSSSALANYKALHPEEEIPFTKMPSNFTCTEYLDYLASVFEIDQRITHLYMELYNRLRYGSNVEELDYQAYQDFIKCFIIISRSFQNEKK